MKVDCPIWDLGARQSSEKHSVEWQSFFIKVLFVLMSIIMLSSIQGLYSQHFIFSVTYEWPHKGRPLH
jgi:hypothetical protein